MSNFADGQGAVTPIFDTAGPFARAYFMHMVFALGIEEKLFAMKMYGWWDWAGIQRIAYQFPPNPGRCYNFSLHAK